MRMKLLYSALAAATILATPALGAVVTDQQTFTFSTIDTDSRTIGFWLNPGTYQLSLDITSSAGFLTNFASIGVGISNGWSILTSASAFVVGQQTTDFDTSALFQITTYSYLSFDWYAAGQFSTTQAEATIDSVTTVPGPEAGAGLAGLAMAGVGAYVVRRRRQNEKLAA